MDVNLLVDSSLVIDDAALISTFRRTTREWYFGLCYLIIISLTPNREMSGLKKTSHEAFGSNLSCISIAKLYNYVVRKKKYLHASPPLLNHVKVQYYSAFSIRCENC